MSRSAEDNVVKLVVSPDRMVATIVVAPEDQRAGIDAVMICAVAEARGIKITGEVSAKIDEVLKTAAKNPEEFSHVIAEGTEPQHGSSGKFELSERLQEAERLRAAARNRGFTESDTKAANDGDEEDEALSHYSRSTLQIVYKGETIGQIIPHRVGVDGVDALGRSVAANNPKPFVPEPSPDIRIEEDDTVTALRGGLLVVEGTSIKVQSPLVITGAVDFSVGNIDFPGGVEITGGVKDRFSVRADEDVKIIDVVEAAEIHAGQDLFLERGITARGKGSFSAGRDAHVMYIDSADGEIGRDLHVGREIKNSSLKLNGSLHATGARIAGGEVTAGGEIELAIAGVEAGTETVLNTGHHDRLEKLLRAAAETHNNLRDMLEDIHAKLEVLNNRQSLTGDEIEELTLLNMQVADYGSKEQRLAAALANGAELLQRFTSPKISVMKRVFPGTIVRIGLYRAEVTKVAQGPLTITLDEEGQPIFALENGSSTPLSSIAKVERDETLADFSAYLSEEDDGSPERLAA